MYITQEQNKYRYKQLIFACKSQRIKNPFPIAYYLMLTSHPTKLGTTCLEGVGGVGGSTIGDQWFKSCKIRYGIILMHVCIVL